MTLKREIDLIGACFGWGAQRRESESAPELLFEGRLEDRLNHAGICSNREVIQPLLRAKDTFIPVGPKTLPLLHDMISKLSKSVRASLEKNNLPLVIGGDHSIAIGTWSAVYENLRQTSSKNNGGDMGLLWIDAHLDAHTPETTPSKAYHGMPLAALLGYGEKSLVEHLSKNVKLQPENTFLLGVRSWEIEEYDLLKDLGVTVYTMENIRQRSFKSCFREAVIKIESQTKSYGLTIDLDAFDPGVAPGVGSPAQNGLYPEEVFEALSGFGTRSGLMAMEIVEYNPERDREGKTMRLLEDLVHCLLVEKPGFKK